MCYQTFQSLPVCQDAFWQLSRYRSREWLHLSGEQQRLCSPAQAANGPSQSAPSEAREFSTPPLRHSEVWVDWPVEATAGGHSREPVQAAQQVIFLPSTCPKPWTAQASLPELFLLECDRRHLSPPAPLSNDSEAPCTASQGGVAPCFPQLLRAGQEDKSVRDSAVGQTRLPRARAPPCSDIGGCVKAPLLLPQKSRPHCKHSGTVTHKQLNEQIK